MDAQFWLNVVVRWIHVASAVVGVGAVVFVRLVLAPAVQGEEFERTLAGRVLPGFKRLIHISLGLLLLSGIYNLVKVLPRADGLGELKTIYHMVLGTKILLGFLFIALAIVLLVPSSGVTTVSARRSAWLGVVVLAAVILLLSAILRRTWDLHPLLTAPTSATGAPAVENP